MSFLEVASLIQQGQVDEALRVCLKDQSTPPLDAEGHAGELLWIAAAFAKQGRYEDALEASRWASESHSLGGEAAMTVRAFEIVSDPANARYAEVRDLINEEFIPKAERDMQKTVAKAKRRTPARTGCRERMSYLLGGVLAGPLLTVALILMLITGSSPFDAWWQIPVALIVTVIGWWTFYVAIRGKG